MHSKGIETRKKVFKHPKTIDTLRDKKRKQENINMKDYDM